MSKQLTLILGGVRAGKSSHAQQMAQGGGRVLFVATAEAGDAEMEARIRAHQASRPADWETLEEPLDLVAALAKCPAAALKRSFRSLSTAPVCV